MKKRLLATVSALMLYFSIGATTCPNAQVVPASPSLPYTVSSIVCGTANDMPNPTGGVSSSYLGGLESVYTWTPTSSYTNVTISYTGQTYSAIFLFAGCPTSGGTLIAGITGSGSSKTLNLSSITLGGLNGSGASYNIIGGTTYYIVFDTWPSPASPCAGSFTINGTVLSVCSGTPSPGNTVSSVAQACSGTPFTLSLSNAPALSLLSGYTYQWESSTNGGTTWTPISGATGMTYSATQSATTDYRCQVSCSGGALVSSTPINVTMNSFLNCYCSSSANYSGYVFVSGVDLGTISNTSGTSLYSDYTSSVSPTSLNQTSSYSLNLTLGNTSAYSYNNWAKVYIDYNQDGSFDPINELVLSQGIYGAGVINTSFTVPSNAVVGQTRMRVIAVETSSAASVNPCGTYSYGETEDYFINIIAPPTCLQVTNITATGSTQSSTNLSWVANTGETQWQVKYHLYPSGSLATAQSVIVNTNPTTQLTGLTANSIYRAYVRAICAPGDTSQFASHVSFNTFGVGSFIDSDNQCGTGFQSIVNNPTAQNLGLGDEDEVHLQLPFSIYYQGATYSDLVVGSNGGILLGVTTGNVGYTISQNIPALWPYVQDLNPGSTSSNGVFADVIGTAPNRKLVVEWNDVVPFGQTDPGTFQVVYEEATKEIYFLYDDVLHNNVADDYGADAEIGATGPQNIILSQNNSAYLQQNSCVRFYYTDCPKPTSITFSAITNTTATVNWVAGVANEASWSIEYGPAGFTPGTGTVVNNITSPTYSFTNLTQITSYDVYVYAECAVGVQSLALIGNFSTLPNCSDPTNIMASTAADTINATWSWAPASLPVTSFNVKYSNYSNTSSSVFNNGAPNYNAQVVDSALMAGGIYNIYVQSVCNNDTSNYVGPVQVTMPLTNDLVCGAQFLPVDGIARNFNGTGATASQGEDVIAPPVTGAQTTTGWANAVISHSTWFKFTVPSNGQMRFDATDLNVDGQIAIYSVGSCSDFATFTLVAANDNSLTGSNLSPNFTLCTLTPGTTYYMMYDPRSTTTAVSNYSLKLSNIVLNTGTANPVSNICNGSSIDLVTTITGQDAGGTWIDPINTGKLVGSNFNSLGLAYTTFNFVYKLVDGCASDSTITQVRVFAPSSAGEGLTKTACKNEPFYLPTALTGTVDQGGTWYDPQGNAINGLMVTLPNISTQMNYQYIVSNGVCPADTATVLINVVNTCDWLSTETIETEGLDIYPNPTDGLVNISYVGSATFNFEVLDLNGRIIYKGNDQVKESNSVKFDMTGKEAGVYMVKVYNNDSTKMFKLMVK